MYDTIVCLIKYLPYKKDRFQNFLECRDKLANHINDMLNTNIPIIYSHKQIKSRIIRVRVGRIQDIMLNLINNNILNLEEKINHIVDYIKITNKNEVIDISTFSWNSYNNYPKLLIPLLDNLEESIDLELDNIAIHRFENYRYRILITHFHPYISDDSLKRSIEQLFSLFMLTFENMTITNNINSNTLLNNLFNIGKRRLEVVLEVLPDKFGLLTFGDINHINEYGVIISLYIAHYIIYIMI